MTNPLRREMNIYFDGGCKPNPGMMETCIVVCPPTSKPEPIVMKDLGQGTSNIAEWSALLLAVSVAIERNVGQVQIIGDSKLVINQALGLWRCKNATLMNFKETLDELSKGLDFKLSHINRDRNLAGRYLEHGKL